MSRKNHRSEPDLPPRRRVGEFHFAASGPREYRLMADLYGGGRIELRTGPSIGDLWHQPLVINAAIESDVIGLQVEQRPNTPVKGNWQPVMGFAPPRRDAE